MLVGGAMMRSLGAMRREASEREREERLVEIREGRDDIRWVGRDVVGDDGCAGSPPRIDPRRSASYREPLPRQYLPKTFELVEVVARTRSRIIIPVFESSSQ